jgi:hypothetical protein
MTGGVVNANASLLTFTSKARRMSVSVAIELRTKDGPVSPSYDELLRLEPERCGRELSLHADMNTADISGRSYVHVRG